MTKVEFDRYTGKYFIKHSESNVVAMTFPELEDFKDLLQQICSDEYSRAIQFELDINPDECEGGACKI